MPPPSLPKSTACRRLAPLPVDEAYTRSSNVVDAASLRGKLMLIVGELDDNVDPASTL